MAKHHERKDCLGEVGETVTTRRSRIQGVGNDLQGIGTSGTTFGKGTWGILAEMERKVEGTHTVFLNKITEKQAQQIVDGTWETPRAEVVR